MRNSEMALEEMTEALDREDFIAAIECEAKTKLDTLDTKEVRAQAEETAAGYFERQASERAALSGAALATPFLSIAVVKHCLSVAVRVAPFVEELRGLTGVRPERLALRERALAFWHADTRLPYASGSVTLERSLVDEGKPLRDTMLHDWGRAMVLWNVLTAEELAALKSGQGHDDLAQDLKFLGERCVREWGKLKGHVNFTIEDARRALQIGTALMEARATPSFVEAGEGNFSVVDAKDDHKRAFTLLLQSLDEYRLGLMWLRRDDRAFDVDSTVPSAYIVRRSSTPKRTKPSATTETNLEASAPGDSSAI